MSSDKQLWLLAGGNGAGKSTFYELFLRSRGLHFINADRIARIIAPQYPHSASYDAARIAQRIRASLIREGVSFCLETVFSHPSKIDLVADAKAHGYQVIFVFIHLDNVELNLARVSQRVALGGHNVPEEKVVSRLPRALENARRAIAVADRVYLLDNSSSDDPFVHVAEVRNDGPDGPGRVVPHGSLPKWAREMLRPYLEG